MSTGFISFQKLLRTFLWPFLEAASILWLMLPLVQFSSVFQSCPTFYNLMDCSTPGFPVHHQLLEPIQTHVYRVSDAIQPSRTLSSIFLFLLPSSIFPSIRVFSNESALRISGQNIGVVASASVLPMNIQDWCLLPLSSKPAIVSSVLTS